MYPKEERKPQVPSGDTIKATALKVERTELGDEVRADEKIVVDLEVVEEPPKSLRVCYYIIMVKR